MRSPSANVAVPVRNTSRLCAAAISTSALADFAFTDKETVKQELADCREINILFCFALQNTKPVKILMDR